MYKHSEPIRSLHSVEKHMANVYSLEVCLQTRKFPKISKFFFFKNTPKYDKLSKISNISIKTMLELRTKFGNFGNFGHICKQRCVLEVRNLGLCFCFGSCQNHVVPVSGVLEILTLTICRIG